MSKFALRIVVGLVVSLCITLVSLPAAAQDVNQPLPVVRAAPANDNFAAAAGITWTQTLTAEILQSTVEAGEPIHPCFGVEAKNSLWYKFVVPDGTITLSTENSTGAADNAVMTIWAGTAIDDLHAVECDDNDGAGNHALISRVLTGSTYFLQVSRASTLPSIVSGTLHVNMDFIPSGTVPANNLAANAVALSLPASVNIANLDHAGISATDPVNLCVGRQAPHSLWFKVTPTHATQVVMSATSSFNDTALGVYTGGPGAYTPIACNDDHGRRAARMQVNMYAGVTYFIVVSSSAASGDIATADTDLYLSYQLLSNGDFETEASWSLKNITSDKRKCNSPSKTITFYGQCAFVFKGGVDESSNISQIAGLPSGYVPVASDRFLIEILSNGPTTAKLKAIVELFFSSGLSTTCKMPAVPHVGGWRAVAADCVVSPVGLTGASFKLKHKSTSGKISVDDVWLQIYRPTASPREAPFGVLPPPAAPLGWRVGG